MFLQADDTYHNWLKDLKKSIKTSQIKAALAVNNQLILLYWQLGKQITEKQENAKWGSGFIDQLSKDLKEEFPEMGGFSSKNLRNCRVFYQFHHRLEIWKQFVAKFDDNKNEQEKKDPEFTIEQQLNIYPQLKYLIQIPWGHNLLIIQKSNSQDEAIFYIQETIENNWSRAVLEMQIETNLFSRQGKAITNFKQTLPEIEGDLAQSILKDPYNFGFLNLQKKIKERDLELKLIENISVFLMELGKGFAYLGRQFLINVGGKEFRTDLLFFHTKLKCYIIIELKVTEFEPEYLGKLNFYVSAIDKLVKSPEDKPTIGILLCKSKNNVVVDFALQDINKPLGVTEFTYKELPDNIKNALPTIEQLTSELNKEEDTENTSD